MSVWTESVGEEIAIRFLGDAEYEDVKTLVFSEIRKALRIFHESGGVHMGCRLRFVDILFLAIEYGREDLADLAIKCDGGLVNADPTEYDECPVVASASATSPLEYAAYWLRLDIAQSLIDDGAEVNENALVSVCKSSETMGLVWEDRGPAETGSALEIAALLIEQGADANHECAPLQHAAASGNVPLVRFLIAMGADPERRGTFFVESALYTHIRRGNLSLARGLKKAGMVLWERERSGRIWEQFQRL